MHFVELLNNNTDKNGLCAVRKKSVDMRFVTEQQNIVLLQDSVIFWSKMALIHTRLCHTRVLTGPHILKAKYQCFSQVRVDPRVQICQQQPVSFSYLLFLISF